MVTDPEGAEEYQALAELGQQARKGIKNALGGWGVPSRHGYPVPPFASPHTRVLM